MFEREQLERNTVKKWLHSEWEIIPDENGEFFWVDDVNSVLNKMEARINELEFAYESHVNDMYLLEARIKELEKENNQLKQELDKEEKLMDYWGIEGLTTLTENNQLLRAENEQLKQELQNLKKD